jgi:crotonobetainyl-CoA:carnitine CoA-transferase CaiB-like acyl-CoA transferase
MANGLDGVHVVDALGGLLGGYCAKMLRDAGADVTLLEPSGGDELREWTVDATNNTDTGKPGALFRHLRAGQRAVRADDDEQRQRWAASADCVIVGPEGVDVDALHQADPGLVVVSITPYGRRLGPHPVTDFTLQADAGGLAIRGRRDRDPYHAAGRTGDWFSAAMAATAAAAALRRVRECGHGGVIDLSRAECTTLAMTNYASLMADLRGPKGLRGAPAITETPAIEPTLDGFVVFTTNTFDQFSAFCIMIGRPEFAEQFASAGSRQMAWDEWNDIVHEWTSSRLTAEIIDQAVALRIPVAPVCNGATALNVDHFIERDVFVRSADDSFTAPRRPWAIEGDPFPLPAEPPGAAAATDPPQRTLRPGAAAVSEPSLPLAGVRVLDTTAWWAGPMATWLLATLGAEVIHVESTSRPDGMRLVGGMFHDQPRWWERSWFFLAANTNKSAITLDLAQAEGRELYRKLVADVDVVVENYTPRVFDQFGFSWDVLRAANPRLVFARMPAFGLDGPWRDRSGFAQTMESLSGLAWVTGHVDDQPRLQGGPCDPNAGVHAAFAIIAALARRDATGAGALLEIPMVESALNIAAEQVIEHSACGTLLERMGNRGPYASPQGLYAGIDGRLAISAATDEQWVALTTVIAELGAHDRFVDIDTIDDEIERWAKNRETTAAAQLLNHAGVPAAVVRDPRLTTDHPEYGHRGFYETADHEVVGQHTVPGLPFRLSGVDRWIRESAPTLGADNAEVLARVDVDEIALDALTAAEVIGTQIRT